MNMKKIIKQLAFAGSILCIALSSCSKLNDLHDEYLANGEITYSAKVDRVGVYPGNKRAVLNITITSQRIETVRIYWNNYSDSIDLAVNSRIGVFEKMIENLEENDYLFYLVSFDKFKNKSLPFEASGTVYGDRFQNSLSNRRIQSLYIIDDILTVNWGGAPANALYSELIYTGKDGKEHFVPIPLDETSRSIDDFSSGLQYRTLFMPETTAIDTFRTEWRHVNEIPVKHPIDGWSVVENTGGQHGDMSPDRSIDGNPMSTWHTNASLNFPYYIIIDFGKSLQIDGIVFQNRLDDLSGGTNWPKKVKWEASNDLVNWVTILSLDEMTNTKDELWLSCTTPTTARYLKFNMYSGWRNQQYGYIGEMGIYHLK
jgi:hypothetical protein